MALYATDGTAEFGYTEANLMRTLWASATAPLTPGTGEIYFDTAGNSFKRYNGSTWDTLVSVSGDPFGSPAVSGMALKSTTGGTRSWSYDNGSVIGRITSATGDIANTDTIVVKTGVKIPASVIAAGATFLIRFEGLCTGEASAKTQTFNIRAGANGTTADTSIGSFTATTNGVSSTGESWGEIMITFGSASACVVGAYVWGTPMVADTPKVFQSSGSPTTSSDFYLSLSFATNSSGTKFNFRQAWIQIGSLS